MRYLLDSTFSIDFLRGRPDATDRMWRLVAAGDDPYISDVVLCELATGIREAERPALEAFVAGVEFVQPGPETARQAGLWRGAAQRRGETLSVPDALIAATAEALRATVITRNRRDFALTPIAVEGY
ncbi:MAG TPA: PIN domain-containing protein [Candidatus Limnocylindrales bacterium]|nr:PIN domain-containing protein [Candidatus Limnocylindrales bacterium]